MPGPFRALWGCLSRLRMIAKPHLRSSRLLCLECWEVREMAITQHYIGGSRATCREGITDLIWTEKLYYCLDNIEWQHF